MKSLAKNYFWNLLYQVLVVLLPLITAPYLSRVLGADRIGEYSFAQSIVSYFVLFSVLGTTLYGQRRIATCYAKGESKKQAFIELIILRGICTLISLGIYFSIIYPKADNQFLYLIAAIEILAVVFDISWFYQGIEQFGHIALCNAFSKVLGAAAIFLFVKTRDDLEWYVLFYCGSLLLGNVVQWFFLPHYLKDESLHRPLVIPHLKPTLRLFVSQFAIQAYTVLDKTMIGLITQSDFENGYYDQAQKLIKALSAIVNSIGIVMASRIAIVWNANKEKRDSQIQGLLLFSFRLVFAISLPLAAGTMVIACDAICYYERFRLGFGLDAPYYNAGVIYFNLPYWREHNLIDGMFRHLQDNIARYTLNDQDLLNDYFRGQILKLPQRLNCQGTHLAFNPKQYLAVYPWKESAYYSLSEIQQTVSDPSVVHFFRFLGDYPWQNGRNYHPAKKLYENWKLQSLWHDHIGAPERSDVLFRVEKQLYRVLPKGVFLRIFCFVTNRKLPKQPL